MCNNHSASMRRNDTPNAQKKPILKISLCTFDCFPFATPPTRILAIPRVSSSRVRARGRLAQLVILFVKIKAMLVSITDADSCHTN